MLLSIARGWHSFMNRRQWYGAGVLLLLTGLMIVAVLQSPSDDYMEPAGPTYGETVESLEESYDFNRDGAPETLELAAIWELDGEHPVTWYELRVKNQDGKEIWRDSATQAHVGWNSLFACKVDGRDTLLRYQPTMYQGVAEYKYSLFSLDEWGSEVPIREGNVVFDINTHLATHVFDVLAVATFLEEVHGYLDNSTLLLTTESETLRSGGPGSQFRDDLHFLQSNPVPYDAEKTLVENLEIFCHTGETAGQ